MALVKMILVGLSSDPGIGVHLEQSSLLGDERGTGTYDGEDDLHHQFGLERLVTQKFYD
jgi:hypothetical protein